MRRIGIAGLRPGYAAWAILFGLLISNTVGTPNWVKPAVQTEYFIKTGLVLLGAEILFSKVVAIGIPGIFVAWVVTPIVLVTTYLFGQKVLKIPSKTLNVTISADMSDMRASIWPGLIQTLSYNLARQQTRVRAFESGLTLIRRDGEIEQHPKLAGLIHGEASAEQWGVATRKADFYDVKADVESVLAQVADPHECRFEAAEHPALHPGQGARILRNGEPIGWIGLLHPVAQKALDVPGGVYLFEIDLVPLRLGGIPEFEALSKFPAIRRDFALLVDRDLPYQAVLDVVHDVAPTVVKDVQLFDVYTGDNIDSSLKSLALSLILQESSHTLTDAEVEQAGAVVLEALGSRLAAKLRD